jgi:hypothetical protein
LLSASLCRQTEWHLQGGHHRKISPYQQKRRPKHAQIFGFSRVAIILRLSVFSCRLTDNVIVIQRHCPATFLQIIFGPYLQPREKPELVGFFKIREVPASLIQDDSHLIGSVKFLQRIGNGRF